MQRVICTVHRVEVNSVAGLLVRWGGHVEELRRRCGDVVGVKAGAYLIDRFVVNVGCAGINRRKERDENARHRRSSDPRWPRVMHRHP